MADAQIICAELFPAGFHLENAGEMIYGEGVCANQTVSILGTRNSAPIGVDLAFALAGKLLEIIKKSPQQAILVLVDTQGQLLSRRDELLGNAGYLAHLSKCFELARIQGHPIISLVYNEAVSGGYLALGMMADQSYALSHAQIRVMALPAMSRITLIPLDQLEELCKSSPIFGPGVANYLSMGALDGVWEKNLANSFELALNHPQTEDRRAERGSQLGGRTKADFVICTIKKAK